MKLILTSTRSLVALGTFLLVGIAALMSFFWVPYAPGFADTAAIWTGPSPSHWLGTDGSGRDIASRLLVGARVTVLVPLGTGALALVIGIALAWLSALGPRWLREPTVVVIDVLIAFPTLLIAIMLVSVSGSGIPVVVLALGLGFGVSMARVMRSEFSQAAREDYVYAARALGLSPTRVLWRHIIPSALPVMIVQLSLVMGLSLLAESSLSYLGFGAPPEVPSWGRMLAETQSAISAFPLTVLWPGLAILLVVHAFFQFGDVLRLALDPSTTPKLAEVRG